jgi:hypothetical protein
MAMIVSNAARLKPEIRLAEAISPFEAGLTSAQKVELRNSKTQSLKRAPDSSDVMRLTADIDRQTKGKRCFGPRFTSFLGTVQQFAALGDVIVGGSQNIIACGVWSLVRSRYWYVKLRYSIGFESTYNIQEATIVYLPDLSWREITDC